MIITDEQIMKLISNNQITNIVAFAHELIAIAQEVPPLSWSTRSGYHSAIGLNSLYKVLPTDEVYSLVCITGDATVSKVIASGICSIEEAEKIANEHNHKRILSHLKYGGDK